MADGDSKVQTHMSRGNLVKNDKAWNTVGANKADRVGSDLEKEGDKPKPEPRKPYKLSDPPKK